MKLWISSETSYTALTEEQCDDLRKARNHVETVINSSISSINYLLPLDSWDCIAVVMGSDSFEERTYYSVKRRNMDFRLHIDHAALVISDELGRQVLVFAMLWRSLDLLSEKLRKVRPKLPEAAHFELNRLRNDVLKVAEDNLWVNAK